MKVTSTPISGLYVLQYKKIEDQRGALLKPYSLPLYEKLSDIQTQYKEVWFTYSKKDVIRGMHMQAGEKACEKVVTCLKGTILDVVLDLRESSATYGKYYSIELTESDCKALYIPKNCAHAYKVIEDDTIVMYMATEEHFPQDDRGISWDSFGFDWSLETPILSDKDRQLPPFEKQR